MENRYVKIVYKNIIIHTYKGSRIFKSVLSAKRHITKALNHFNNDKELTWRFYTNKL